jgi:pimeloyl-ACP methyl ester carboxylesterase
MPIRNDPIRIAVDDEHIAGTIVEPTTRIPGVLFVHGWGGSQEQYIARAREIAALGCVCMTFDLRGHAATKVQQETVTRENNLRDVVAAYDMLASHPNVDASAIAVVGSSYGGYLASILTTMRPVKWLALRAPALYMDTGWEVPKRQLHRDQNLGVYRQTLVVASENRALRACAAFRGDVLIIESEFDTIIPHAVTASYREAAIQAHSLTYRVLRGADHGLTEEPCQRAYTNLLVNWVAEMVFGESVTAAKARPAPIPSAPRDMVPETPPV